MIRIDADKVAARLPWFYHGLPFDPPHKHGIWSVEINGLAPDIDRRTLTLGLREPRERIEISRDGLHFYEAVAHGTLVPLAPVVLSCRRLTFYVRADSPDQPCPVADIYLHPANVKPVDIPRVGEWEDCYVRDIGDQHSEPLRSWDEFWPLLHIGGFYEDDLREMYRGLAAWCERRQVVDESDPHFGAVYSEEDKYDFRDAAAAAVVFAREYRRTRDAQYLHRAQIAREYTYRGQHTEGERRGGWAHMVSGRWGGDHQVDFTRITQPLPPVDGVDTAIIINLLCTAIETGLVADEQDLRHIEQGADWVLRSELAPGVFAHHEGARHDCQNSNVLASMALARAHNCLAAQGMEPPETWLEAAWRGFRHWLEGQEAIGVWPYQFATIGRGQRFGEQNVPDHGMGLYHFLVAAEALDALDRSTVQCALRRAARWYLCTCRIDRDDPMPTIDLEYDREGQGLLFSSFTWCRFMAAASLMRIAAVTDEEDPWRPLALSLMKHVRLKLWDDSDPEHAPVVASSRQDIRLHSWIAAAEWEAVLLLDMLGHLPSDAAE